VEESQVRRTSAEAEETVEESGDERGGRPRYVRRPKVCQFCVDKVARIDYKNSDVLRRLVSDRGKIRPRRQTGTCAHHQRALAVAIKRARHMALIGFGGHRERAR
jgi:small subunit ribosomal protein S18